jgi:hypothetical protein
MHPALLRPPVLRRSLAPLSVDVGGRLAAVGARALSGMGPLLALADPAGRLSPESAHLCAALSLLATEAARGLGGAEDARVGQAAAMLALLTKLDDQHIDSPAFHASLPRAHLARETAAYLAPTLASIRSGRPESEEPRCLLAAALGAVLAELATLDGGARREGLLRLIASGWATQVEAVTTFTAHPSQVSDSVVARVTGEISARWLRMITAVGTLAPGARALTADEVEAFSGWGAWIQRADALADLEKDSLDLHLSTVIGRMAYLAHGERWVEAVRGGDRAGVRRQVGALDLSALRPAEAELDRLEARLASLGEVGPILRWIHGFLLSRDGGPCSAP